MFDDLTDLYQEVILDHNKSPRNFHKLADANRTVHGQNPLCGDQVTLYLRMDGDFIRDISWEGSGCAIFKASTSLLTSAIKGKSVDEVKALFARVRELVTTGKLDQDQVGKLAVFAGVHKFPARVKCAILPWHAALAAVEGKSDSVSTE